MGFNFEKFEDTDLSFSAYATVRQRTGQLGFNSGAVNRFEILSFRYVVLYFDADRRAVGIELTNDKGPGTIELKKRPANTFVPAKNFLDKYGIDYEESHRHRVHEDPESKLLYFLLDAEDDGNDVPPREMTDDEKVSKESDIPEDDLDY